MAAIKQKIVPHLWFDKEAREAAEFYVTDFPDSEVTNITTLHDTPSGDSDIVSFKLRGYAFMAISAGPLFKFNPSISFMVNFDPSQDVDAKARIDALWAKLSEDGKVLMPLDTYPFSERYGWTEDKYGLSWQLILTNPEGEERPLIIPSLLFVGNVYGKAEEASAFYLSVFRNLPAAQASADTKRGALVHHSAEQEPDREGTVMFTDFKIEGQWFAAMDSALDHHFQFNEAISFMVYCKDQAEIDYYWGKLSADPRAEQCGWIKDKYGVSWQIVPAALAGMMRDQDTERLARVTQAFLKMKKLDLAALQRAFDGQ